MTVRIGGQIDAAQIEKMSLRICVTMTVEEWRALSVRIDKSESLQSEISRVLHHVDVLTAINFDTEELK